MADETIITANDNTGADGGEAKAPEQTGAATILGGDPTAQPKVEQQEGEQKPVVPEAYEDFKLPEGIEIDKSMLDGVKAQFKEAGYTQDQAQKAIDLHIKNMQEQQETFIQTRKEWVNEIKSDPEFGGDKFDATVRGSQLALRKFDTDGKMVELLETSGFGDHPGVIKFMARVHAALGEDPVHGERHNDRGNAKPLHERLYGKDGMGPNNPE